VSPLRRDNLGCLQSLLGEHLSAAPPLILRSPGGHPCQHVCIKKVQWSLIRRSLNVDSPHAALNSLSLSHTQVHRRSINTRQHACKGTVYTPRLRRHWTEQLPSALVALEGSLLADRERLLRTRLLSRAADAAALRVLEVMIRSRRRRSVPCTVTRYISFLTWPPSQGQCQARTMQLFLHL
jgi:hypothetical protein